MKTALIDVGGGFRGTYGAGVMDYFMDENINFDYTIGVSAGSGNIANYLAGQRGRCITFYTQYGSRKECTSFRNLLTTGSYINLDYLYNNLASSDGENPLDFPKLESNPAEFLIVATDALTGKAKYFTKDDLKQDDYSVIMASSSLPAVGEPTVIGEIPYFDGGLSDPVPVQKAVDAGCDKIVLILTKPRNFRREPGKDLHFARLLDHRFPEVARRLRLRYKTYNYGVDLAEYYVSKGKLLIIAPDNTCNTDTITRNEEGMIELYAKGYDNAKAVKEFLGI